VSAAIYPAPVGSFSSQPVSVTYQYALPGVEHMDHTSVPGPTNKKLSVHQLSDLGTNSTLDGQLRKLGGIGFSAACLSAFHKDESGFIAYGYLHVASNQFFKWSPKDQVGAILYLQEYPDFEREVLATTEKHGLADSRDVLNEISEIYS
jgi:hypothetical protein